MEYSKLYEQLRNIRMQHGETQESLAEKLGVNPQAIKAWEKPRGGSEPKLKNLLALCDCYKCDLDHLVGRIKERTHDNKTACELTGLSEAAIDKIRSPQQLGFQMSKVLSHLIESQHFESLMTTYQIFLLYVQSLSDEDVSDNHPWFEAKDGKVTLGANQAVNHFKQETEAVMRNICDSEHLTRLAQLKKKKSVTDRQSLVNEIASIQNEITYLEEQKDYLEKEVLPELFPNNE